MDPSFGFGGLKRSIAPGRLPFLRVKLATGLFSLNSLSPDSVMHEQEELKRDREKEKKNAKGHMNSSSARLVGW